MKVEPSLLRLLWAVIEDMPSHDIISLSDTALIAMLMQEVSRRMLLSGEEVHSLYGYIGSKISLIRDTVAFRGARNSVPTSYHPTSPVGLSP